MNHEDAKNTGQIHRHVNLKEPSRVYFGPTNQETQRFEVTSSAVEARTFVSRDLLTQFEEKIVERIKSLESDISYIKSELEKLFEFRNKSNESLNQLNLSVNENKIGLKHVAKDVELERFRSELEKTRRELEGTVSRDFKDAEKEMTNRFNERTKTSLKTLSVVSAIIALIVSTIITIIQIVR